MTLKSVGKAALAMVEEVRRQFNTINGLMEGTARPDYSRCVKISTDSSLREMIPPGECRVEGTELVCSITGLLLWRDECVAAAGAA
jgi:inorganic pyrophosphatase